MHFKKISATEKKQKTTQDLFLQLLGSLCSPARFCWSFKRILIELINVAF